MRAGVAPIAALIAAPIAMSLAGCATPPEDAPPQLQDVSQFIFANADSPESPELIAALADLRELVEATDFSLDIRDRAVTLDVLNGESLGELSIPEGAKASNQVPRGVAITSAHSIEANAELALEVNRVCIESDTTKYAMRTFTEGEDCFPASCDTLRYEQPTRKENALAKVWYDQQGYYHLIDVAPAADDEEATFEPFEVLLHRYWIDDRGFSDDENSTWDQLFGIEVTMEGTDGQTLIWKALWSSIDINPIGIGDDSYGNLVVDGLAQSGTFGDEFIDGVTDGECEEDRDAEKPERN